MNHGFGIDTAFTAAVERWRAALKGEAVEAVILRGPSDSLLPTMLEIETPHGRIEFDVGSWPTDLPLNYTDLRNDSRVWELFTTEWSLDEIRSYLDVAPTTPVVEVRAAFVRSSWWLEFESMVGQAFAYEWRAALEALARPVGARVIIARPDPDDASLLAFAERLNAAASRFEASSFDARLLYDEGTRKAAFLIHTSEVED